MARIVHVVSFVLTWLCATGLVSGMIYEARTHDVFFEAYISTFSSYGIIFGIIAYKTRTARSAKPPVPNPHGPPESNRPA